MPGLVVDAVLPVLHPPGSYVDLAADDGLYSRLQGGLVEGHRPVHDPVVRDGHGLLPQLLHPPDQRGDAAGAVQEAEFTVNVQMYKGHGVSLPGGRIGPPSRCRLLFGGACAKMRI